MKWEIIKAWGDKQTQKLNRVDVRVHASEQEFTASEDRNIFIPEGPDWEGLTEEVALAAAKEAMGEFELDMLEYNLDTRINEQKNPIYIVGLPWTQS